MIKKRSSAFFVFYGCSRIDSIGKQGLNSWLYDLCQIDCMLVDEVNSMSNGQGIMVHGHGV